MSSQSSSDERRFVHYTMKITDRQATKDFFCNILGMKILRHEEMDSGCAAQCNGDFESPWSKTIAGYGDEDSHFCFELNFNYDVQGYKYGDDFSSVTIRSRQAVANARRHFDQTSIETTKTNQQSLTISSPDGHRFILIDEDVPQGNDPVQRLSLNVSNLTKSLDYYTRLLKMKVLEQKSNDRVVLYYGMRSKTTDAGSKVKTNAGFVVDEQCQLELIASENGKPIDRGTGYGRKAFTCLTNDIERIQKMMEQEGHSVLIPEMKLGGLLDLNKVTVVILSDPDGHEICFVGEENYIKACNTDKDAEKKFAKGLENTANVANKYLPGEDESTKRQEIK